MPHESIHGSIVPSISRNRPLWSGVVLLLALSTAVVTLLTLLIDVMV